MEEFCATLRAKSLQPVFKNWDAVYRQPSCLTSSALPGLTEPATGYERAAEAAVETGVRYLQLRMKKRAPAEILAMACRLRRITAGSTARFIVNDDVEIAREAAPTAFTWARTI